MKNADDVLNDLLRTKHPGNHLRQACIEIARFKDSGVLVAGLIREFEEALRNHGYPSHDCLTIAVSTIEQSAVTHVAACSAIDTTWEAFDYRKPPAKGIYWVVINTPEFDVDVDSNGHCINVATGQTVTAVKMAFMSLDLEGFPIFETVDWNEFGDIPEEATVSHFAAVMRPALPVSTLLN